MSANNTDTSSNTTKFNLVMDQPPVAEEPGLNFAESQSTEETKHKLERLKYATIKSNDVCDDNISSKNNDWMVIYSDSNSSIFSSESDGDEQNKIQTIDIAVVDESIIPPSDIEIVELKISSDESDMDENNLEGEVEPKKTDDEPIDCENDEHVNANEHDDWETGCTCIGECKCSSYSWIRPPDPVENFETISSTSLMVNRPISPPPSFADNDYESSEVEIIEEDNDDDPLANFNLLDPDRDSILSMSISSVISQSSNLSLIQEQYLQSYTASREGTHLRYRYFVPKDSVSEAQTDDLSNAPMDPIQLSRGERIRAYVHTPNTVLNGKLNLVLILSVTAVIGLGIGHFIGWSNNWRQNQLSMAQVVKLKQLQDDLMVCMKDQDSFESDQHKVCLADSDYWKQRFETLFNENKGLIELFQKTQRHFRESVNPSSVNVIGEHECVNKSTSDEFHKLKLGLLVNQMEHLKLLEALEEVKSKGEKSEKRVRVLEEENLGLKKKLEEEEEDDQQMEQTWGNRVALLETENEELRNAIVTDDAEDEKVLSALRGKINSLDQDNKELKMILEKLEELMLFKMVEKTPDDQQPDLNNRVIDSMKHRLFNWLHKDDIYSDTDTESTTNLDRAIGKQYVARYTTLRDQINTIMVENAELKSKILRYRWALKDESDVKNNHQASSSSPKEHHHRLNVYQMETQDAHKNDQPVYRSEHKRHRNCKQMYKMNNKESDKKMLKTKINLLHRELEMEQNESKKWKKKFELMMQKMRKMQAKHRRKHKKLYDDDDDDEEEDEQDDGEDYDHYDDDKLNAKKHFVEKVKKAKSSQSDSFHKNEKQANNKKSKNVVDEKSGDKVVRFGRMVEHTFQEVHNFAKNLLTKDNGKKIANYFTQQANNLVNLVKDNLMPDTTTTTTKQNPEPEKIFTKNKEKEKAQKKDPNENNEFFHSLYVLSHRTFEFMNEFGKEYLNKEKLKKIGKDTVDRVQEFKKDYLNKENLAKTTKNVKQFGKKTVETMHELGKKSIEKGFDMFNYVNNLLDNNNLNPSEEKEPSSSSSSSSSSPYHESTESEIIDFDDENYQSYLQHRTPSPPPYPSSVSNKWKETRAKKRNMKKFDEKEMKECEEEEEDVDNWYYQRSIEREKQRRLKVLKSID